MLGISVCGFAAAKSMLKKANVTLAFFRNLTAAVNHGPVSGRSTPPPGSLMLIPSAAESDLAAEGIIIRLPGGGVDLPGTGAMID